MCKIAAISIAALKLRPYPFRDSETGIQCSTSQTFEKDPAYILQGFQISPTATLTSAFFSQPEHFSLPTQPQL
jgi:hypothetical protein